MNSEKLLSKSISIPPSYLNDNLINTLIYVIKQKYEKTCNEEDGLILSINSIENIKNTVSRDGKEVHFFISFNSTIVKPHKGIKISFKPTLLINKGIFGKLYDVFSLFIPETNMKGWSFENNSFVKGKEKITKDTEVSAIISDIKFNGTKYNCICTLAESE